MIIDIFPEAIIANKLKYIIISKTAWHSNNIIMRIQTQTIFVYIVIVLSV